MEGAAEFAAPFQPAATFFSGIGPKVQHYGPGSNMAKAARDSLVVGIARERYYEAKANGTKYNPNIYFGPTEYVVAALLGDSFSHVMGSVRVDITEVHEGVLRFTVTNNMTMGSLLGASLWDNLGLPDVARAVEQLNHDDGPGGTVQIQIDWYEQRRRNGP